MEGPGEGEEAAARWQVGDQVLCRGKLASVRYVGGVHWGAGVYVGVEFAKVPAGRHTGEVGGVRYFGPTAPDHALLIREDAESLVPYTEEDEAATRLQAQVRRKRDAESAQFAQTFRAFSLMESRAESQQLDNNAHSAGAQIILADELDCGIGGAATGTLSALGSTVRLPHGSTAQAFLSEEAEEAGTVVVLDDADAEDGAPRLEFVLGADGRTSVPRECVARVLRHLKHRGEPLAAGCVAALLRHGMELLRREVPSALLEIALPPAPGRCVILGDTHGQLEDVLWLFFEHGEPSAENVYLFNGDVADRGRNAVEIMVLILLFKLWDPRCVHMNRGNHEDPCMNETYGFRDECTLKWGQVRGLELFGTFNSLFQLLPLASLVGGEVFVVHGGLCRKDFRLAQFRRIAFRRPLPERPGFGLDVFLFDSVWSDPHAGRGIARNPRGDSIVCFGSDVTRRFLQAEGLRLLVRSHEVPDTGSGYQWHHGGRCLTIFSASNYCGDCGNLGGALILARGEEDTLLEHYAPSLEELQVLEEEADRAQARLDAQARCISSQRRSRKVSRERMEADVLRRVQELVVRRRAELFDYWAEADTSPRGVFCISPTLWREGCASVLDDTLPWVRLQEAMGVANAQGEVHYVKFLSRFRVAFDASFGLSASGWERAAWGKLMETLLRADLPLREALAALDATSDGLVSGTEFARLIVSCHVRITPLQAKVLLRSLAAHPKTELLGFTGTTGMASTQGLGATQQCMLNSQMQASAGRVSVWDMLGRLTVSLPMASPSSLADPEAAAWAVPLLKPLATAVLDDAWRRLLPPNAAPAEWPVPKVLAAWFEDMDRGGSGYLEEDEFVNALATIAPALSLAGCATDRDSLGRLFRYCDVVGNGRINYFELLNSLTWEDALGDELREDLTESIHAAIYFNIAPMRTALRRFDLELAGRVSPEDFTTALRAVRTAIAARAGSDETPGRGEIDEIVRHLPRCAGGAVDYEAFLRSFRIVDTQLLCTPRC